MKKEELMAGLAEICDLNLSEFFDGSVTTISRLHFKIYETPDGFVLIDLRSRNGTKLNDDMLASGEPYFLRDNDIITLAKNKKFKIKVDLMNYPATDFVGEPSPYQKGPIPEFGLYFDEERSGFVVDGLLMPATHLTELENNLLHYLYKNAERVCSHNEIAKNVWGFVSTNNTITVGISHLRKKLKGISDGAGKRYIKTRTGFGYMLTKKKNQRA